MLVTDAMPPVGTQDRFTLMGQDITVVDGTCRGRTARWPDRR
jgi:N-acetylglucosamine-6-phosphate deacetylase